MKKIISLITSIILVCGTSTSVFATTTSTKTGMENAKEYMLNIGLDSNFVKNAPDSEISKYVNAKLVSQTTKYYRTSSTPKASTSISPNNVTTSVVEISKAECDKEVAAYNASIILKNLNSISPATSVSAPNETSWMKMLITASSNGTSGQYFLSCAATWITTPNAREDDVLAMGHDSYLTTFGTASYFYTQCYDNSSRSYSDTSNWVTSSSTNGKNSTEGIGYVWSLPSDYTNSDVGSYDHYSSFYAYMSYTVQVASPTWHGLVAVASDYEHQQTLWSFIPSFSFPIGASINLTNASSYDATTDLLNISI